MIKLANPQTSSTIVRHLLWAAMEKIGKKELDAGSLPESSSHTVNLQIRGTIDGCSIAESIESMVSIGKSQEKSSSVNPQVSELVAWILSKLNTATRSRILEDLPSEFVELGGMPESNPVLIEQVNLLLKTLRQTRTITAKAPVRCQYMVKKAPLDRRLTR